MPEDFPRRVTPETNDPPRRRALALRWHLVLLVLGAILPLLAFAAVAVYHLAGSERAASDRRLMRSARDLSLALDREIQATVRTLGALAESEKLDRGDLEGFHAEAKRVVPAEPGWLTIILLTPDGQQVVNTNVPWGSPLPGANEPASLARLIKEKRPLVGSLTAGKMRNVLGFPVRVPVVRAGEVRYVLTAVITTEAVAHVVGMRDPSDEEWTRAVVDGQGTIVGRSREPERFVGQKLPDSSWRHLQEANEGLIRETALDGTPVYIAYTREPFTGWTTAVAVPARYYESSARGSTITVLGLGLALLCLSTLGAFAVSRHISRGLLAATAAAETIARGGQPRPLKSPVKEVAQLGRALAHSAALLARREEERNEHLAHADVARREAETARRLQEVLLRELLESEERLQLIADHAPVLIVYCGADRTYKFVNKPYAERFGLSPSEIVGRPLHEVMGREAYAIIEPYVDAVLRGERVEFESEVPYEELGARHMWVAYEPEFDEGGRVTGFVAAMLDITRQKRAEAERERLLEREKALRAKAEEANRLKDEFLATVSHELRTPLTAIMGWAHMLENSPLDEETARHAVKVISRNAEQQRQIVEDVLDVSRIVAGKFKLEAEPLEIAPVVQAALDTTRPAAEAKGIRLRSDLGPGAVVTGDPARLQQVVWNLLANAVKFTPPGGEVRVSAQRILTHVRIEVSDTGPGIPPEFLPYVFDRFRQADSSTTRQHGGLGLGLSIVRHLVEAHGGSVHAYSAGEGQGATFTVDLPLPVDAEPPPAADDDAAREAGGPVAPPAAEDAGEAMPPLVGVRVLLVDDDDDTLEMLQALLRRAGAEVTAVTSAGAALGALERVRPDVMVADIGMPGVDGYELVRRVRSLGAERGGQTPAVALTAYAGEADRVRALRSGFQTHLAKPVAPSDLVAAVVNLAGRIAPSEF
ncbi:MAG TPA: ATP-binding protein [Pyrinomonadaceae bacterium]|nr:ATP-binding protein [Pyrinomonadaceae bacterium]